MSKNETLYLDLESVNSLLSVNLNLQSNFTQLNNK